MLSREIGREGFQRILHGRHAAPNKSLNASGGSVFLNLLGAVEGALIRAAASTQPLGGRSSGKWEREEHDPNPDGVSPYNASHDERLDCVAADLRENRRRAVPD